MKRGDHVLAFDGNGPHTWRPATLIQEAPYHHRTSTTLGWYISWTDLTDVDYQNGASAGGWKSELYIRLSSEVIA